MAKTPDGLETYRAKRRFSRTPEPKGGTLPGDGQLFVVQKHHASHMHYDLRLQIGGTLKSWAVPEGPCLDPKVRRFAKLTEDHPIEYADFEGHIPAGEYGAGSVIVWDRGTWVTLAEPQAAFEKGEIKFRLAGEKLSGGWMLKRLPDDPTNWLLIKERDIAVRPIAEYDVVVEEPNSILTGRPVDDEPELELAPRAAARKRPAAKIPGAKAAPMPKTWKPQLAGQAETPPRGEGWVHEIKYDGYRTLVFVEGGKAKLITRNGHDWTHRYVVLAKAFEKLPCKSAILDGEVAVQDPRGITSLDLLERALSDGDGHAMTYFAFDLVYLDGHDLAACRLDDRKEALEALLQPVMSAASPIQLSQHIDGDGEALFAQASRMGLEGIVSKKADARYQQTRAASWVKIKKVDIATFVIIGFLSNMPRSVSSLVIAEEREDGLVFASRVGSGISEQKGRELYAALSKRIIDKPVVPVPKTPGAVWVEPAWTCEVGYRSRSVNDSPRAPVLLSWQERQEAAPKAKAMKPRIVSDRDLAGIHLTNPERQIGPEPGTTKLDIALYYARVGDWLLPEVLNRPVTVIRCPSGDISDLFYQRHPFAGLPPGVEAIDIRVEGDERPDYMAIREARGFLGLPQFGALEFHLWGCHADDPEHPDRIVMDLDPDESLPWARICDGAELVRARFEALGFQPFLRTTGGKGVHVVVALEEGAHDWPTVKGFSEAISRAMAADAPNLFTANSTKPSRRGKIYLDYLRNTRGASAVASYSLRAKPGFPAATPIAWEELRKLTGGNAFNRVNLMRRLDSLVTDPWDDLESSAVKITPKMRRDVAMKT